MAAVRITAVFPATVHQAESCWYDTARWPDWVDEVSRVIDVTGPWPQEGGAVVWESGPAGRGRVSERVTWHEPLDGQALAVEDESISGEQVVTFTPVEAGTEVELALRYRLKRRNPLTSLVDLLFVRRLMAASLQRTLERFAAELESSAGAGAR